MTKSKEKLYLMNRANINIVVISLFLFMTSPELWSQTEPQLSASDIQFSDISENSVRISWKNGNGNGRLVMLREWQNLTSVGSPVDDTFYNHNTNLMLAPSKGPNKIVYAGSDSSFLLEGLDINTLYGIGIFEYNSNGDGINYRILERPGNSFYTLGAAPKPTLKSSNLTVSNISHTSTSFEFDKGDAQNVLAVIRENNITSNGSPKDGKKYEYDGSLPKAPGIGPNRIIYIGNQENFNVNDLKPNTKYAVRIFDFNGVDSTTNYEPGPLVVFNTLSNDNKNQAVDLNILTEWCSSVSVLNNIGATNDGPAPSIYTTLNNNVWFKFQAQTNGIQIKIPREDAQSLNQYVMALFDENNNEIDATRFNIGYEISSNDLSPGNWYYLSVGGSDESSFSLCLNDEIANDFKEDALDISFEGNKWQSSGFEFDNQYSTNDGPAPTAYNTLRQNVWFKFQARETVASINLLRGSMTNTHVLALFDENNNEINSTRFNKGYGFKAESLVKNQWYYLSVGSGVGNSPSTFDLSIEYGVAPDALEIQALRDLYEQTDGPNWTNNTGWPTTAAEWDAITSIDQISGWYGITISSGDIQEISLVNNNLTGDLPDALGFLISLKRLDLKSNNLSGALPLKLGDLEVLTYLRLSANDFTGQIPEWTGLTELVHLYLDTNSGLTSGPLPDWISTLNGLKHLFLGTTNRTGSIPSSYSNLTSLHRLYLNNNDLVGELPVWLSTFTHLQYITVAHNEFTGHFPEELRSLIDLRMINLESNQFSGPIPFWINELTQLTSFYVGTNNFIGQIPQTVLELVDLVHFSAASNQFTSLPVFKSMPGAASLRLKVRQNYISQADIDANLNPDGSHNFNLFTYNPQQAIPAEQGLVLDLAEIQALRDLYESTAGANWTDNTGWPSTAAEWDAITSIDQVSGWYGIVVSNGDIHEIQLKNNALIGTIPVSIANLLALRKLYLGQHNTSNQLSGSIPVSIGQLKELQYLILAGNELSGEIPSEIFMNVNLTHCILSGNQLSGSIPESIGNALNLVDLTLASNNLSGDFPASLWTLTKLRNLYLEGNDFGVALPDALSGLVNLSYLNLNSCGLTGPIPESIGLLKKLSTVYLSHNSLSGNLPESLQDCSALVHLFIQKNNLHGKLPDGLCQLPALESINLDRNQLTGAIPSCLSTKSTIKSVRLWKNNFTSSPNFSNHPNKANLILQIQINYIPQSDIEANLNPDGSHNFSSFTYDPQNTVPAEQGNALDIAEIQALRDLYEQTDGANWTDNTGWPTTAAEWDAITSIDQVSGWNGLTVENGDVVVIDFNQNNLIGDLPVSLSNLKQLKELKLYSNNLGGVMPAHLGELKNLEILNLMNNDYHDGVIPESFSQLFKLKYLALTNNKTGGNIPESLTNLVSLETLRLDQMQLTGEIPIDLGNLSNLTHLFLGGNFLSGTIPNSIGNLDRLEQLRLDRNQLEGELPPQIFNSSELSIIYLFRNSLSGEIPNIDHLSKLRKFLVSENNFSGSLPEINNRLEWAYFFDNNFIGKIPSSYNTSSKLSRLLIQNNKLTELSSFLGHAKESSLRLNVYNNHLTFDQIEQNLTDVNTHPFDLYNYAPQNSPEEIVPIAAGGDRIIVADRAEGKNNQYQWQKWNGSSWADVAGPGYNTAEYTTNNAQIGDRFRCKITNTWVADVTIYSSTFEVTESLENTPDDFTLEPLYNGNITSMKWRTSEPHATTAGEYEGSYLFSYDDKYQLTEANWGVESPTGLVATNTNKYRVTGLEYDANGNIERLKRFDQYSNKIHDFVYDYNTNSTQPKNNQLEGIDGYAQYHYNSIGQLDEEIREDGQNKYVDYDVTGKVKAVYADADKTQLKVSYTYDDRGFRLSSTNEETDIRTWYIRDASGNVMSMYEEQIGDGNLTQTEVPVYGSGKVGVYYAQQDGSTAYEVTDHLGNVRAVARRNNITFTATMEDNGIEDFTNPRVEEMQYFKNLFTSEQIASNGLNRTVTSITPKRHAFLNGAVNRIIGPAITLEVSQGDDINMEAFAKYEIQNSYAAPLGIADIASALTSSFIGFNGQESISALDDLFGAALTGFANSGNDNNPKAFFNYILFDKEFNVVEQNKLQVYTQDRPIGMKDLGGFEIGTDPDDVGWLQRKFTIQAPENGYLYVYVSNHTPDSKVYFDDISVTLNQKIVTQATDYYPGGSVARSADTPNAYFEANGIETEGNDFGKYYSYGYQGQFAEEDSETGWNSFELRMYDPVILRWTTIDPYGVGFSPYWGMNNNWPNLTDPDGGCPECPNEDWANWGEISNGYEVTMNGVTYTMSDITLGQDGWVRTHEGGQEFMLQEVIVSPSVANYTKDILIDYGVGAFNGIVDVPQTVIISVYKGYGQYFTGERIDSFWEPHVLDIDPKYDKNNNLISADYNFKSRPISNRLSTKRANELMKNTISFTLGRVIKLPMIKNPILRQVSEEGAGVILQGTANKAVDGLIKEN